MMMMVSFFSIYDGPNTLCVLTNLIFPTLLWSGYHYGSHLRYEEMRLREVECLSKFRSSWMVYSEPSDDQKERCKIFFPGIWGLSLSLLVVSESSWLLKSSNNNKDASFSPWEILFQQIWVGPRHPNLRKDLWVILMITEDWEVMIPSMPFCPSELNHASHQMRDLWGTLTEYTLSGKWETIGWHANPPFPSLPVYIERCIQSSGPRPWLYIRITWRTFKNMMSGEGRYSK